MGVEGGGAGVEVGVRGRRLRIRECVSYVSCTYHTQHITEYHNPRITRITEYHARITISVSWIAYHTVSRISHM